MKFQRLGDFIQQVMTRNTHLAMTEPRGINMHKEFIQSVANTIGTDMSKYRVVKNTQFAYNPMHVGRDHLVPIALHLGQEDIIVSPAYVVFEITKPAELLPQFLMFWFKESNFDRRAWFTTDNSVRGGFSWESLCNIPIPIPTPEEQALICLKNLFEAQSDFLHKKELLNLALGK
ncbi:TPA: restriction endonuclease subunit S [Proteus mirabilis]